jgi:hypothetical protein
VIQNKTNSNQMNDDQIWYKNQNDEIEKKNQFKKGFKTKLIEIKTLRIKYDTKTKWQDNIQSWRASLNSQEEEREKKEGKEKRVIDAMHRPRWKSSAQSFQHHHWNQCLAPGDVSYDPVGEHWNLLIRLFS